MSEKKLVIPDWPAPDCIHAATSTRQLGNMATQSAQDAGETITNRNSLHRALNLPEMPYWLNQTHSTRVTCLDQPPEVSPNSDAAFTSITNRVCAVLTADCLPILVCSKSGAEVAAIHAGWRGLLGGILDNTINAMKSAASDLIAWIGPAIGVNAFEINDEIKSHFLQHSCFKKDAFIKEGQHLYADLYQLASANLQALGICAISGKEYCTYTDESLFFSHRREQKKAGRMATLIWISAS